MTIINYQVEKQTDPSRKIQDDRNICVWKRRCVFLKQNKQKLI